MPPGSDVRYRGDPGGAAHSIGAGRRGTGGIMRKRLSAQRCWNPPMCRAGTSAHGSPSAENLRSRKIPESRGKPGIGSWGRSSPMCNTPARTEKNPTRPRGSPPGARPVQAPREVVTPPTTPILASVPPLPARKAQCTYKCMVFPDTPKKGQPIKLMPSQCAYRCVVLPDAGRWRYRVLALLSQCTCRCVVLPDREEDGNQRRAGGGSQCTCRCVVLPDTPQ